MPTHYWGDDFDWKALGKAINIISKWCHYGRIGCHAKEKYGTARIDVYFWDGSLHSLIYPGYCCSQFPKWLWLFDIDYIQKYMPSFVVKFVHRIQRCFYTLGYYFAMKKYPHIVDEIAADAQMPEWIIGGKDIHDRHWTTTL